MWRDVSGVPYGHSSWFWYLHMTTNTRSRTDMWGSFHHWDGRCNVTSAPKYLRMERNRSAPRRSARFKFWLNMMCWIICIDIRHSIMNMTSACGFIMSLVSWKPIPITYEWGIITKSWWLFMWWIICASRIFLPNLMRWIGNLCNLILAISHRVWISVKSSPLGLSVSLSQRRRRCGRRKSR